MSVRRVAVIGAGWAGCAAAVELASRGMHVTLLESARTLGGRARRVEIDGRNVDNGQHIMLGAYRDTLKLLRKVGADIPSAVLNVPLQMRYAPGAGGMDFIAPRLPAPFHLLGALLRATGLQREDKLSLARFSTTARWMGWQFDTDCTVTELLHRFDQTPRLTTLMWRPLCLAALNTPPERASANVFLAVLRDSLGASRAASDMLVPKVDLSALLPDLAARYVTEHGGTVYTGAKATALLAQPDGGWRVQASGAALGDQWEHGYDAVVLACGAPHAASLLDAVTWQPEPATPAALATRLRAFTYEAITTVYLQYAPGVRLDLPFIALIDTPPAGHWGQFVFDRGQLDEKQAGLLAVIISASGEAAALGQAELTAACARQLAEVLRRPELAQPQWARVITEKRATFACAPALDRPANATGLPGLVLAGDYTAGEYPATLEGAVRSGMAAALELLKRKK
ncbi:hydroxysqualene dehydroxylase HpnE [Pseudoduganella ginsengisoli]|uniref:FAD-dependent oxidoreductase n=1 Tax=Pseudoduganella ginsengisoli TaxID=1462440 RepID=A0A6L6Q316_9BURK|nr:hydroxysqualene dehydroxylase HpnE [Pseudoduganella ginsengisoli]MTW04273.1 FAD-dependent oxidoreductase [Pseudoduganella ginsengisoli]